MLEGELLLLDVSEEATEAGAHRVCLHLSDLKVHLGVIAVPFERQRGWYELDLLSQRLVDLLQPETTSTPAPVVATSS